MISLNQTSEEFFTPEARRGAHEQGWLPSHIEKASRGGRILTHVRGDTGFADIFATRGGRIVYAELKVKNRKPQANQEAWLAAMRLTCAECYVWWPKDAAEIERVLKE